LGPKPNPIDKLTEADYNNVDCLMCHGPDYKRTVVKEDDKFKLVPAEGVDVLAVAQNAQRPTSAMCLRCHTSTGGGPNAKHGVIPTKDTDVHMAAGLQCVECHTAQEHKIPGGSDLKAQELPEVKVDCSNCHTAAPHEGEAAVLNEHTDRIACQTCHIPLIARDPNMPTTIERDWTTPVFNEQTGLYRFTDVKANNVMPEYHWWNRRMVNPPEPVGSIDDPSAKITPWKRATYTNIADKESGEVMRIKAGAYFITGNPVAGAKKGSEATGQPFSGEIVPKTESMVFSLNHQVASSDQSLKCNDCHSAEGRLDFAALGYSPDRISVLASAADDYAAAAPVEAPAELPVAGTDLRGLPWLLVGAGALLALGGGLLWKQRR
jgi:hypothetical protein